MTDGEVRESDWAETTVKHKLDVWGSTLLCTVWKRSSPDSAEDSVAKGHKGRHQ